MDAAESLYEEFKRDGLALIRSYIAEHRPEDGLLDFKTVSPGCPPMQSPDQNNLADAISGFSNADGGVIVWGVLAKEGKARKEPALAMRSQPIAELSRFVRDLQRRTALVTAPMVAGVKHLAVKAEPGADHGFVVTYVPRGEGEPVQRRDDFRYYIRIGDSFMPMPHTMVADRFGRRPKAHLELRHFASPQGGGTYKSGLYGLVVITLELANTGRGIALYPMLAVRPHRRMDDEFRWSADPPGLAMRPEANRDLEDKWTRHVFAGTGGEVVHPNTSLQVARLRYKIPESAVVGPLAIDWSVYCDGSAESNTLTIPAERLVQVRDAALRSMRGP